MLPAVHGPGCGGLLLAGPVSQVRDAVGLGLGCVCLLLVVLLSLAYHVVLPLPWQGWLLRLRAVQGYGCSGVSWASSEYHTMCYSMDLNVTTVATCHVRTGL